MIGACPKFTASYHPATNEAVKSANSTLVLIHRKMATSEPLHWPCFLDAILLMYRISYYGVVGLSPFEDLYSLESSFPLCLLPIVSSLGPGSSEDEMRLIINKLFRIKLLPRLAVICHVFQVF